MGFRRFCEKNLNTMDNYLPVMVDSITKGLGIGLAGVGLTSALVSGMSYATFLAIGFDQEGIQRFPDGSVSIGRFYSPSKSVSYKVNPEWGHEKIVICQVGLIHYNSETLYDTNNDGLVDVLYKDDLRIERAAPGTEDLFQRADQAWKDYTLYLNIETVLSSKEGQIISPQFYF